MRALFQAILISIFIFSLTACKLSDKRMGRFYTILMHAKKDSISRWDSEISMPFVGLRTGMVLSDSEFITLTNSHVTPEGGFRLNYRIDKDHAAKATIGSAVPITEDGYFLTARHCVDDDSDTLAALVIQDGSVGMVKTKFRIVWISHEKDDLDLALIHSDVRPFQPFEFADQTSLSKGNVVGAAGWSALTIGDSNPLAGLSVGELLSIKDFNSLKSESKWRRVQHTAPLHPGDSGGPIVNEQGELLGINAKVRIAYSEQVRSFFTRKKSPRPNKKGYVSIGAYPDTQWLESAIRADREKRQLSLNQ